MRRSAVLAAHTGRRGFSSPVSCGTRPPASGLVPLPGEGGFSYNVGASQTVYYGVPITRGEPVADLHGTILLTWALAMIFELVGENPDGWQVIRP